MLRTILTIIITLAALPAQAVCSGPSFMERLTPEERAQIDAAVAATPYAEGLIWRATRGDQEITLIGTMHIYDPRLEPINTFVSDTVTSADLLLVEATAAEEAAMQDAMANDPAMIFITDGPTLPEQLAPEAWDAVRDAVSARQIPPFLAAKMQPWYLSLTLSIPACAMPDVIAGIRGLDHMIMSDAEVAGVPTLPLEPWTTLLDVMRDGTAQEQLEMLQLSLLDPNLQSEMFVSMLDSYFSGAVAEVWEASRLSANYVPGLDPAKGAALFAETEQELLINRNLNWMPVIADAIDGHTDIVIAVGAAHLPGEQGVLRLLETDGWQIARIN